MIDYADILRIVTMRLQALKIRLNKLRSDRQKIDEVLEEVEETRRELADSRTYLSDRLDMTVQYEGDTLSQQIGIIIEQHRSATKNCEFKIFSLGIIVQDLEQRTTETLAELNVLERRRVKLEHTEEKERLVTKRKLLMRRDTAMTELHIAHSTRCIAKRWP